MASPIEQELEMASLVLTPFEVMGSHVAAAKCKCANKWLTHEHGFKKAEYDNMTI